MSCSPAAEPLGKASAHYQIDDPKAAGVRDTGTCNATAVGAIARDADNVAELPTAGSDRLPVEFGELVVDGQNGDYTVECSVVRTEGGYNLDIELSGPNTSPHVGLASGTTQLNLEGTITDAGIGTGEVVVFTTHTSQLTPNVACELKAIPGTSLDSTPYQITDGEARLVFTCTDTTSALDDFSTCETRGTIWVSDCLD